MVYSLANMLFTVILYFT